jgi:galactosamine-6-phosphate isomerase
MDIKFFDSHEEQGIAASDIVINQLHIKPDLMLCTASGFTPIRLCGLLAEKYNWNPQWFNRLKVMKLDEWGSIPRDHLQSSESYLQERVVKPKHIEPSRYLSFNSLPDQTELECKRIEQALAEKGGIVICMLGLGANGHIAFNEPADYLPPESHIASLPKNRFSTKWRKPWKKVRDTEYRWVWPIYSVAHHPYFD